MVPKISVSKTSGEYLGCVIVVGMDDEDLVEV